MENLGQTKKVEDYYGAPQELKNLEDLVAKVAESEGWEKIN
ncbi:MAG: hypothetical protein DHS20C18_38270 [Saprospiraceae bacterium]|nr:MAG: hypothetical protein DHS20C18_38270 [Saprospiraceae bacterium]